MLLRYAKTHVNLKKLMPNLLSFLLRIYRSDVRAYQNAFRSVES